MCPEVVAYIEEELLKIPRGLRFLGKVAQEGTSFDSLVTKKQELIRRHAV